jgi:lysine 2,3-aminomutase
MTPERTIELEEEPPSTNPWRPRGREVMLPHGGLPEVASEYIKKLIEVTGGIDGPIGRQYVARPEAEQRLITNESISDPLSEDAHEVAPGLVYKYEGRALLTITRMCGVYCRFCTRGREVGIPKNQDGPFQGTLSHTPTLTNAQLEETFQYIEQTDSLREIILSGGDPLTVRRETLDPTLIRLGQMQKNDKLDFVRIGTRLPMVNPDAIREWHYDALNNLTIPHVMVHINHPAELTDKSVGVLQRFRRDCDAVVMTQSVLLRGVNDDPDTLIKLFTECAKQGFRPYYLYQNDPVPWANHFTVPIEEAIAIWQEVRPHLSGIAATARFVIDTPGGYGKIPVPEGGAWEFDDSEFRDFHGSSFPLK